MRRKYALTEGFTLVEVLVVLLIASIVMVVLVSVLGSSFEILRTGETRAQLNSNARVAIDYISSDLASGSYIPLAVDRDLNGYPDEDRDASRGYNMSAVWRIAQRDSNNDLVMGPGYFFSEAWSDRVMVAHNSSILTNGSLVENQSFVVPKLLVGNGNRKVAEYTSFFRLVIPANGRMPYYLQPPDRLNPASSPAGEIFGYPENISVGPHKETATLAQDFFYTFRDDPTARRVRLIPVSSNITRVKLEYLHEVPVYMSRINNNNVQIAYQDLTDGTIYWENEFWRSSDIIDNYVPLIDHWELRIVDVAYDQDYTDTTGLAYSGTHWDLADQYPEGLNPKKLDGTEDAPDRGTGFGLGWMQNDVYRGWRMCEYYNIDNNSDEIGDNGPVDRLAYVTNSLSGGQPIEGGMAFLRGDIGALMARNPKEATLAAGQGRPSVNYRNYAEDPTGASLGDLGDADGIPDGDGIPDDPVPGWWLPYVKAVRVTVVATPKQVIEERTERSGVRGKVGNQLVYYRLDSPVPYSDVNRTVPLYNQRQDYVGGGKDIVLTKTVPVNFAYGADIVADPNSDKLFDYVLRVIALRGAGAVGAAGDPRRALLNYAIGANSVYYDPYDPDSMIRARDPFTKRIEKEGPTP